jgi:hypothetical protein
MPLAKLMFANRWMYEGERNKILNFNEGVSFIGEVSKSIMAIR